LSFALVGHPPPKDNYRIGILSGLLEAVTVATSTDPSEICVNQGVAPIMLVHGFNSHPPEWSVFQPLLVERLAAEFTNAGLGSADAVACAQLYVHAVALAPRNGSYANGSVLSGRIQEFLDHTGAEEIDMITHSRGGLDSRQAIQLLGTHRVPGNGRRGGARLERRRRRPRHGARGCARRVLSGGPTIHPNSTMLCLDIRASGMS
jgi:triacylglycerol esterase/lipase EstA (alpha/beta hydrolase family)